MDMGLPERLEKEGGKSCKKAWQGEKYQNMSVNSAQIFDWPLNHICGRDYTACWKLALGNLKEQNPEMSAVAYIRGKHFGVWGWPKLSARTKINSSEEDSRV